MHLGSKFITRSWKYWFVSVCVKPLLKYLLYESGCDLWIERGEIYERINIHLGEGVGVGMCTLYTSLNKDQRSHGVEKNSWVSENRMIDYI